MIKNKFGFVKQVLFLSTFASLFSVPMAFALTGEISFTPTGLKLPVMKISIAKSDGTDEQNLYTCPGANEASCLVDLSDQTALTAIGTAAGAATIRVGTYNTLNLNTCVDGTSGMTPTDAYVKGSFTTGGGGAATYYTDSDVTNLSGIKTTGSAEFTKVGNWACATKSVKLASPIVVAKGDAISLTVLVDNTLAAFSTPADSSGMGGCKNASPSVPSRGVCMTYPAIIPVVGSGIPTTKKFTLAHSSVSVGAIDDTKANAMVIVALNSSNTPLAAFGRTIYTETSAAQNSNSSAPTDTVNGGPSFVTETDISTFTVNADGTIAFKQGASGDTHAAAFDAFQLVDHTGTETTRGGASWFYHAILTP